jgi:TPR repeat protein
MTYLGAMYENGSGVEQDHSQALAWYRKAAALGDEDAKASLKRMETPRKSKKGTTRKDPTK